MYSKLPADPHIYTLSQSFSTSQNTNFFLLFSLFSLFSSFSLFMFYQTSTPLITSPFSIASRAFMNSTTG